MSQTDFLKLCLGKVAYIRTETLASFKKRFPDAEIGNGAPKKKAFFVACSANGEIAEVAESREWLLGDMVSRQVTFVWLQ
jgi:hypothetical protein